MMMYFFFFFSNNIELYQVSTDLTQGATQLLVYVTVISNFSSAHLAGPLSHTLKPSQMAPNTADCLVFDQPERPHVAPLRIDLNCQSMVI